MTTSTTPNKGLVLYDSSGTETFLSWRISQAGPATSSNMYIIDTAFGDVESDIAALEARKNIIPVSATSTGGGQYVATVSEITSYDLNQVISIQLDLDSNGTTSVNINSLGAKSLMKVSSGGTFVNIDGSDLREGRKYLFQYDGTRYLWINAMSSDQINTNGTVGNFPKISSNNAIEDSGTSPSDYLDVATYDPTAKSSDAFDMDNMSETATAKIFTSDERDKLSDMAIPLTISGASVQWVSVSSYKISASDPFYCENGDVLHVENDTTISGLTSLASSTWYHIYGYVSGGSTAFETTTDVPVSWKGSAYSKTGDSSRRYLGSILTDSSGDIYSFEQTGNYVAWKSVNISASPFLVLSGGTATTATAVDISGASPVTSKVGYLRVVSTSDKASRVSDSSSVASGFSLISLGAGNTAQQNAFANIPTDGSQQIYYLFVSSVVSGGLFMYVLGYFLER